MKKVMAMLMTLVMVLSLAACGGSKDETKAPETTKAGKETEAVTGEESKPGNEKEELTAEDYINMAADEIMSYTPSKELVHKVGLIIPDSTTEFYNGIAIEAKKLFEEAGYEFVSEGINGDSTRGVTVIESWLAGGIDAIVIMAQDQTCDDALKKAMEQGVLVVSASAKVKYYHHWLKQDNYDVGYQTAVMAADWMKEKGQEEGQYICVSNNMTEATAEKGRGVVEGMKELVPDAACVGEVVFTNMDQVRADIDTLLMQNPDVSCIVAMHNGFALIGMESAKAAGKEAGSFAVFGSALSEQVLSELNKEDSMYEGEIWMGDQARSFTEHTLGLLEGKSYPHDWAALNFPISRENLDTYYDDYYTELAKIEQ